MDSNPTDKISLRADGRSIERASGPPTLMLVVGGYYLHKNLYNWRKVWRLGIIRDGVPMVSYFDAFNIFDECSEWYFRDMCPTVATPEEVAYIAADLQTDESRKALEAEFSKLLWGGND